MTGLLTERECARLAQLANVDAATVERIIAAAAHERVVVVLPAFDRAADFTGWETFAYDERAKAAHLAESGAFRALCGAPRPVTSVVPETRTRLCGGCEWHVRALTQSPSAVRAYNRGEAPRSRAGPVRTGGGPPPAPRDEPPPARRTGRPAAAPAPPPKPAVPSLFGEAPLG